VTLDGDATLWSHGIDDNRRPRLSLDVSQLDPVDVELKGAVIVHRVHHGHDVRPSRRADGGESPNSL
jgi:hypothetical protein